MEDTAVTVELAAAPEAAEASTTPQRPGRKSAQSPSRAQASAPARRERVPTTRSNGKGALRDRLVGFVSAHPRGWDHEAWLGLLSDLRQAGIDTTDEPGIGLALERERLGRLLAEVPGGSRTAITRLVKRFGSVSALLEANSGELDAIGGVEAMLAREVATRCAAAQGQD
jgi:hypothetical protein